MPEKWILRKNRARPNKYKILL